MKQWNRTVPGKVTLFILTVVLAILGGIGAVTTYVMADEDFYFRNWDYIEQNEIEGRLETESRWIMNYYVIGYNKEELAYVGNWGEPVGLHIEFALKDVNGNILTRSSNYQGDKNYTLSFWFRAYIDQYDDIFEYYERVQNPVTNDEYSTCFEVVCYAESGGYLSWRNNILKTLYDYRIQIPTFSAIAEILAILCFITLMCGTARRPNLDDVVPGPFYKVPTDIVLGLGILVAGITGGIIFNGWNYSSTATNLIGIGVYVVCMFIMALGICMNFAAHIKNRDLIKSSLIYKIIQLIGKGVGTVIHNMPILWKSLLVVVAISILELIWLSISWWDADRILLFWVLEKLVLVPLVLWITLSMKKLQKGGEAIASGDLHYHTDTHAMPSQMKKHGENLNSIADGMNQAVAEQLKSERMKTELITNVSHDIKTPLTSIINYADLIGRVETDDPTIKEYSGVLVRQSERLKRLIEDLVEASKASTGNLEVDLAPCDGRILLDQAVGEYYEKLTDAEIIPMISLPEEPVMILADGRRMWRIFDNLLNNACKYAMPGTRLYMELLRDGKTARFTFRNISKEPLNISAEELMERFVRGDVSRNTEGNGLGLSIAESLAKLQHGTLSLTIDGDLFKAILEFPIIDS